MLDVPRYSLAVLCRVIQGFAEERAGSSASGNAGVAGEVENLVGDEPPPGNLGHRAAVDARRWVRDAALRSCALVAPLLRGLLLRRGPGRIVGTVRYHLDRAVLRRVRVVVELVDPRRVRLADRLPAVALAEGQLQVDRLPRVGVAGEVVDERRGPVARAVAERRAVHLIECDKRARSRRRQRKRRRVLTTRRK